MFTIDLSGKTAVITGAGRGIAKTTAELLASCGANIVVADIQADIAEASAKEIAEKYGVKTAAVVCDVVDRDQYRKAFDKAVEIGGQVDIHIAVAGICSYKSFDTVTTKDVALMNDVNVIGADNGMALCLEYMKNNPNGGRCVTVASVAGRGSDPSLPHYAMTKAAVINLNQSYAEWAGRNLPVIINYNCVCPGIIRTAFWEKFLKLRRPDSQEQQDAFFDACVKGLIPLGKPQEEIDIANALCFLVSDQARYITGQALNVCGGMAMN